MVKLDRRYIERLSELYPTIADASTEIINLNSILNLPKGTEHFITDIHGEYQAFSHVLRNGSGAVRKKINEVYGRTLPEKDVRELATLIYYPSEKIELVKKTTELQSEMELETAAIEKRYEREISMAEGNKFKTKRLDHREERYRRQGAVLRLNHKHDHPDRQVRQLY